MAMEDPFRTYLHDHLAGSGFAIELLETMSKEFAGHETGTVAAPITAEGAGGSDTAEAHPFDRVGRNHLDLKDAAAWFGEKATRIKLRHNDPTGIGAFEAFEALGLGIIGRKGVMAGFGGSSPQAKRCG